MWNKQIYAFLQQCRKSVSYCFLFSYFSAYKSFEAFSYCRVPIWSVHGMFICLVGLLETVTCLFANCQKYLQKGKKVEMILNKKCIL